MDYNLLVMTNAPYTSRSSERPRSVTLVAWGVLLLGMVNGWRAIAIFKQRQLLLQWDASIDPALTAIASVISCLLFITATILILRRWSPSRWAIPVILLFYTVGGYLLSGVIQDGFDKMNSGIFTYLPLASITFFILTILAGWILNRRAAREYFKTESAQRTD